LWVKSSGQACDSAILNQLSITREVLRPGRREFKLRPFSAGSILRLRNKIEPLASTTSVDLLLQNRSYRASPRRYRSGYWPHYPTWHSGLLHCGASRLKHPVAIAPGPDLMMIEIWKNQRLAKKYGGAPSRGLHRPSFGFRFQVWGFKRNKLYRSDIHSDVSFRLALRPPHARCSRGTQVVTLLSCAPFQGF